MKYLALDIGNVLVDVNLEILTTKLSQQFNVSLNRANFFLKRNQKNCDLGLCLMRESLEDFFNIKSQVILDDLVNYWNLCVKPNQYMFERISHLMNNGIRVGLLSNIGFEHSELFRGFLSGKSAYGQKIALHQDIIQHFSCEIGARKPSSLFFQSFLLSNPEFKGCIFVDDMDINLESAKQFNFQTQHFTLENKNFSEIQESWQKIEKLILE